MGNNARFLIGFQPTPILLTGTLNMGAGDGGDYTNTSNQINYVTKTDGKIHYDMSRGFRVPWGVTFELSRIFSASNVTISTLKTDGSKQLIKTINGGTLFEGEINFGGQETVFIEGSDDIELSVREVRTRTI